MRLKDFFKKLFAIYAIQIVFFVPIFEAQAATYQATNVFGTYYPQVGGAMGTAVAIGGLLTKANPWINALGMGVGVYQWAMHSNDANTGIFVRGSNQPKQVPSWSGNLPPSTYTAAIFWHGGQAGDGYTSAAAGCSAWAGYFSGVGTDNQTDSMHSSCVITKNGSFYASGSIDAYYGCSDGYNLNGSTCNLTNAAIVKYVNDSMADYQAKADGTGFVRDARDNDPTPSGTESTPTQFQQVDPYNTITMTPTSTGGVKVQTANQYTFNGDTYTYYQTTVTNNNGVVIDQTSSTVPGSLASTTASSPAVITQTTDVSNLATHSDVNGVKTSVDQLHTDLTPSNPVDLTTQKTAVDDAATAQKAVIQQIGTDGLNAHNVSWSWFPELPSSSCSPLSGTFGGRTVTLDWCSTVEKIRTLVGYIFYILTAWTLFETFTRRNE